MLNILSFIVFSVIIFNYMTIYQMWPGLRSLVWVCLTTIWWCSDWTSLGVGDSGYTSALDLIGPKDVIQVL